MKKHLFAVLLGLTAAAGWAGEWSLKEWLKDLDAKVRRTESKRKGSLAAAAAVRGSKQDDAAKKLYWKGRKTAQPVTQEELDEFKAGLALAQEGKSADAEKALGEFLQKRPDSPLAEDAKKTLALLKEPAPSQP